MFTEPPALTENAHGKAALWTSGVFYQLVAPGDKWPALPVVKLALTLTSQFCISNCLSTSRTRSGLGIGWKGEVRSTEGWGMMLRDFTYMGRHKNWTTYVA